MIPEDVQRGVERWAAAIDARHPGRLRSVYLVGSLALGDFQPKTSNIDVVAVADEPWPTDVITGAVAAHRWLNRRRRPARVAYISAADLAGDPRPVDAPVFEGAKAAPADHLVNPMTWTTVADTAVVMRGVDYPAVSVDPDRLRGWAAAQLGAWRDHVRHLSRVGRLWLRSNTSDSVLVASRLAVAVERGQAVSLLHAARLVGEDRSQPSERILLDAAGHRQGAGAGMYWGPVERRRDARRLVEELATRVSSSPGAGRLSGRRR